MFPLVFGVCAQQISGSEVVDELQKDAFGQGKVTIVEDDGIAFLMDAQVEINARSEGVDGYRIQLYKGSGPSGKKRALEVKGEFLDEFSGEEVYLAYNPPFWRVRVGDYRQRHEALPLIEKLKKRFPNCYVVKDPTVNMEKFK